MTYFITADAALSHLARRILDEGSEVGTRQGGRALELTGVNFTITNPRHRIILNPERRASLPAQIAETMWVLSGRNDVEWLSRYLPRAAEFSDDGYIWRGAYGPRLRDWGIHREEIAITGKTGFGFDQLAYVVDLLQRDPLTRRAVISLYDPSFDAEGDKDIPCNNWIAFTNRLGWLDMNISIRSNDLIWGWSGINQFEWSVLQELIAGMLGVGVGGANYSVASLHVYEKHWQRLRRIADADPVEGITPTALPKFSSVDALDSAFRAFFDNRPGPFSMWWNAMHNTGELPRDYERGLALSPRTVRDPFIEYVLKLHTEKHKAYGDSWKRRGEMLGILANIARKVDRLGGGETSDETSADTAIDLLVYLVKYLGWIMGTTNELRDFESDLRAARPGTSSVDKIRSDFDALERCVTLGYMSKEGLVRGMIADSLALAREEYERPGKERAAAWK